MSLRSCQVVVYDRLVSPEFVAEAPPDATRIGRDRLDQGEINALLVSYGRRGLLVVRLKGGDPFVFGRGGEEALALAGAGVPFEVVPGVSSLSAVPAAAGIPVTHPVSPRRSLSSPGTHATAAAAPTTPSSRARPGRSSSSWRSAGSARSPPAS